MTTEKVINSWIQWLAYSIGRESSSPLASLVIQLRDSEAVKTYPGIYVEEGEARRIESAGVVDGNAYEIEIITKLVTTPGEDDQAATSRTAHDALRKALDAHIQHPTAETWLANQVGWACHQLLTSPPITTEENGYRVSTWQAEFVACLD